MRILYLIRDFNFGGAENHVSELANSMAGMGNEVFILSMHGKQEERLTKAVHFSVLRMFGILLPLQIFYLCWFIRRNRIEVLHAHKRSGILLGSIAGKIMRIPVVATIHGRPRHDLRSILARKYTNRFIFVSKRTMDANSANRYFSGKSVLIHNGISLIERNSNKVFEQITYLSRIDKRHFQLISILVKEIIPSLANDFTDLTFHIVGEGPYYKLLAKEVSKVNLKAGHELCVLHGYVPEVVEIVSRSGLLLGVGRCAMEGISCSTPVLPVNNKYLGDFVNPENYNVYEENNFVPVGQGPPDPASLESRLRDYLANQDSFHTCAGELSGIIKKRLSIAVIAGMISEVYSLVRSIK